MIIMVYGLVQTGERGLLLASCRKCVLREGFERRLIRSTIEKKYARQVNIYSDIGRFLIANRLNRSPLVNNGKQGWERVYFCYGISFLLLLV